MSDLISRKAIMSHIENEYRQWGEDYDAEQILGDIEDFPTAFDLESAVKQLNENKEDLLKAIKENSKSEYEMIKINDLKELFEEYTQEQIDIIKSSVNTANGKNGG